MSLSERVRDAALLKGDFVLSSGRRSSFYVDKYLFATDPALLRDLARELAGRVPEGVDRLAGVELGAVPLVVAVALETGLPYVIVRKAAKEYGTARSVEGRLRRGDRVALLEDVVTTGAQAARSVETLQREGAVVEKVIAVLDRRPRPEGHLGGAAFEALFRLEDLGVDPAT
ncbi:orotate phosphoribosyltransferase [Rubrobacter taiwanensis]|uniref:Orotate phosphoribosyltransferase n=1 Tax=Rubrobacter taiwanensis TaxID=185139 RepID=A0A4V2NW24_9ACTN|nr:orotate phosphoribosyltransferase [Rubrobacter taiwanensis]TCJ15732.1 orotate phosphoribosyltransferase [Rubrobacter taiwanensis]